MQSFFEIPTVGPLVTITQHHIVKRKFLWTATGRRLITIIIIIIIIIIFPPHSQ